MEFAWHEEQLQPKKPIHMKIIDLSTKVNVEGMIYDSRNESNEDPD